ncbi:dipeptide ABC transporter ATP-binding protein [Granulosicoccus antarcticus]|uniref:Glutathione import ATP-binding protein GsiA n=1 Tax=Granulosicoccus antarcticus IMCC3135 TaxID=1192854 RepID=A0A2Z2P7N1_9GAMM|nr:ABC transporter ATP-binding protein [Granulosicoccus antarcticus]ASJ76697.1 Glutathione import ATP-binding protein GsiA [Granulosicoccus antarcticus IMCC3135]
MSKLLEVQGLTVGIPSRFGEFTAIENVNLSVAAGEIHGIVGESGAGKSTIGSAIIGLLESPARIRAGTIHLQGDSLTSLNDEEYHRLRGNRISMIFQDPQTSLNPLLRIADQLIETIQQHRKINDDEARLMAIELLTETGIENAEARLDDYPHQFSGGMRQRVVIALALCTDPELIIADEPTTALDVSVQKQILKLIRNLAEQRKVGIILITHDIGVVAEITDNVTVLRYGHVVESGPTARVLGTPQEAYTQALMAAVPRLDKRLERFRNIVKDDKRIDGESQWSIAGASAEQASIWLLGSTKVAKRVPAIQLRKTALPDNALLRVDELDVTFGKSGSWFSKKPGFKALSEVSLHLHRGEVLGIVGESGSGKSTLAKAIVGLVPTAGGSMQFNGEALPDGLRRPRSHPARRQIQMIFQDPYSSLNNRRTVEAILTEPLLFYKLAKKGPEARKLVASVLELVEMPQRAMLKYPHQFSGGQRQRIAVARALMARPEFLICDEPTSALDVSIQAQILNLLKDLQSNFGLTILFISHNLAVVRQMADRVVVLRRGQIVETAHSETFFESPTADYSRQLLRETPSLALLGEPD